MKNILILGLLIFLFACKKENPYPNEKVSQGTIVAKSNEREWLDPSEIVQVISNSPSADFLKDHPCYKGYENLSIATYNRPFGYGLMTVSFDLPTKTGTYSLNTNESQDVCLNLPSGTRLFYSIDDALVATYRLSDNSENSLTIEEVSTGNVTGYFKLVYEHIQGTKSEKYPEKLVVECSKFVAVRK